MEAMLDIGAELWVSIEKWAGVFSLDPAIVAGIVAAESGGNTWAARHEPNYRYLFDPGRMRPPGCSEETERNLQRTSLGAMQVMGAVLRERGYNGWLTEILGNVDAQVEYGCRHLAALVRKYGNWVDAVAAYNAGSPRRGADGLLVNRLYVEKVLDLANIYRQSKERTV